MALEPQPTKSVPRRVRLTIERNIAAISQDRTRQQRTQSENLHMKSVETTRPLRGVALFDEKCDFTETDVQEATVRACHSANPGIIIVGILRTASKSHLGFFVAVRTWQHERGALYIMILTDSEETLSEAQFSALETLHRSDWSACLGRDLRQVETGARLDTNIPAMSRARVWTNSFTVAAHIQREAIAKEGQLHSEELFHLMDTVIKGEAVSRRGVQFARDCATRVLRSSWHRWEHS